MLGVLTATGCHCFGALSADRAVKHIMYECIFILNTHISQSISILSYLNMFLNTVSSYPCLQFQSNTTDSL